MQQSHSNNSESKYQVNGYIREQCDVFKSCGFKLFEIIPIAISSLVASYYDTMDYFVLTNDEEINISHNNRCITQIKDRIGYWENTTYGGLEIPSTNKCICKWYIKVGHIDETARSLSIIGIASKPFITNKSFDEIEKNKRYCFAPHSGSIESHQTGFRHFSENIADGKIICIELNLIEKYITFYDYEQEYDSAKVAFDNIEIGDGICYRLAVSMNQENTSLTIIKFQQLFE